MNMQMLEVDPAAAEEINLTSCFEVGVSTMAGDDSETLA